MSGDLLWQMREGLRVKCLSAVALSRKLNLSMDVTATRPYLCNERTVGGVPFAFAMCATFRDCLYIYASGVLSVQSSSWTDPTPFRPSTPACSVSEPLSIAEDVSHPSDWDIWVYR